MPPVLKVVGAVVLIGIAVAIHLLEAFHDLEYLRVELPTVYTFMTSPTVEIGILVVGVIFAVLGFLEMRSQRRSGLKTEDRPASQSTSGPNSPAAAIGSIGQVGPGASVNVGTVSAGVAQVHLTEPILHLEPEAEMVYCSKKEAGSFTLFLVNTGLEDVERITLFVTCFIAQRLVLRRNSVEPAF
ncbi:MAG: hypothetical protein ABSE42_24560 [Bryobacteraceae bacterium]|jgi:hypothetical protein